MTISVCVQTSPSGCHSGSCSQPTSDSSSGRTRSMTPRSSASAKPIDGWCGLQQQLLDLAPDAFGRQIVERQRRGTALPSSRRARTRTARQTARRAAHAGCRRANVVGSTARSSRRSRSARPSKGSSYVSVSGSHAMALMVKSRRRAASATDIEGSPWTSKPLWPRPRFDSRRGSATSISPALPPGGTSL